MLATDVSIGDTIELQVDGKPVAKITFHSKSGRRVSLRCATEANTRLVKQMQPPGKKTG